MEHTVCVSSRSAGQNPCHPPVLNYHLRLFDYERESVDVRYEETEGLTAPRRSLLDSPWLRVKGGRDQRRVEKGGEGS